MLGLELILCPFRPKHDILGTVAVWVVCSRLIANGAESGPSSSRPALVRFVFNCVRSGIIAMPVQASS